MAFSTFFAHVCRSGLGVVREYDTAALLTLAEQSVILEEKVANSITIVCNSLNMQQDKTNSHYVREVASDLLSCPWHALHFIRPVSLKAMNTSVGLDPMFLPSSYAVCVFPVSPRCLRTLVALS